MTFTELNERYLEEQLRDKSSHRFYCRLYRQFFETWLEHPGHRDIKRWHRDLKATPAHANKGLGYLKAMYTWAIGEDLWDAANPATGIRRHQTFRRKRTLGEEELALLMAHLPTMYLKFRLLVIFLLTTGCRVS